MSPSPITRDHVIMARDASPGTIAGATVGAFAAVILILQDALRPGMGAAPMRSRPVSQTFSQYPANRLSQGRIASTAGTLSDRDSQIGKEYGPDGIVYHHAPPPPPTVARHSLPSCSPAPSVPSLADAVAAASRNASPAVAQGPFTPPPEGQPDRKGTFGTLTTEPESLSRSATGSLHGSQSLKGGAFRKFSNKIFKRGSTRSSGSGSESRGTGTRVSDMEIDDDRVENAPAVPYLRDDKPPGGGAADEYYTSAAADYYSGAPLSPPEEPKLPAPGPGSEFIHLIGMPGASIVESVMPHAGKQHLGSAFNPVGAPPSPASPQVKQEERSSEESEQTRSLEAKSDTLSPPPTRGLPPFESSPKRFEPPPSPYRPAPGTVNPMEMMKPTTAAEQAAWVDTEIWKLENSPPPQLDNSPPPSEPSPPSQTDYYSPAQSPPPQPTQDEPSTQPDRPHFQAVVRHPTQMDVTTNGQAMPQNEEQVVIDISDSSSPGFDQYAYGPSPSNHTSPETRFTGSNYTASPSPRSSMSNRPSSSYEPTTEYLETTMSGQSQGSVSEDRTSSSPKPTSFACEICGSKFDQVHKLNHHKRYHERPHQCPQCDKRFGTKTHLDRHINDKHNKTRKYHCTVTGCAYSKQGGGKSFPRKDNWRRHMQNKHQQANPPEPLEEDVLMAG
ncbi:hypothetical protein J7T55_011749 [Diaporthe amygdali]|uniref:uncharacterized protein n=1 Tax=Phomopsis amygdali TaxID=1214568 RepID=UPI0022FDB4BE|nr:uncharacterized protein J7T55_011749 [Diaporthe amygdali]KAJ0123284.1 hypothetical protein J7T55_011749 [Diaporthe amygdali]